jgi:gliding motility-associated protein GldE
MTDLEPPEQSIFLLGILLQVGGMAWSILLFLVLLLFSALISASEVAFFALKPNDIDDLKKQKSVASEKVITWLSKPKELLSIILIVNNFVNIGIVILGAYLTEILSKNILSDSASPLVVFLIQVVLITLILLLFGEMIPKLIANKNASKIAQRTAGSLHILSKIPPFSWLSKLLISSTNVINKRTRKMDMKLSSDDLEQALALTKENSDSEEDHKILEGIVRFGNTEACQIMCSRVDTVAIEIKMSFKEVYETILESGFSRFPVYQDNFDNIVGILYVKDLLKHLNQSDDFDWRPLLRPAFFVPEKKKIDDLLKDFQEKKMHMAVVVDEYGGAEGVVTLEDVLEEIVGEITDEFDEDEIVHTRIDDNTYIFEGKTSLLDMYKIMEVDEEFYEELKGDAESVAGFIIEQSGKIMRKNERLTVGDLTFTVEAADKKRVKLVRVFKNEQKNE